MAKQKKEPVKKAYFKWTKGDFKEVKLKVPNALHNKYKKVLGNDITMQQDLIDYITNKVNK